MTDWKAIGRRLAGAGLPILGAQIGGPAGAAIGREVASRLGVDPDPEVIAQALGDPDTLLELRAMEIEAAAAECADELRAQEIAAADVQHARKTARPVDDWIRSTLAIILPLVAVIFAGTFIGALVWKDQITEAVGIAGMVLGWLIRDASSSTGFYFGTSLGSKKKSENLANYEEKR